MSLINVQVTDTFEEWRVKTNSLAFYQGDLDTLATVDKTSLVAAINEALGANDEDLTALGALTTIGMLARTGDGTAATRTLTGTANKIVITNGDGAAGNPTINVGSDVASVSATFYLGTTPLTLNRASGAHTLNGVSIDGNAASATVLQTTRTINSVGFNGSASIVVEPYVEQDLSSNAARPLTFVDSTTANHQRLNLSTTLTFNPSSNTLTSGAFSGNGSLLSALNATSLATGTVPSAVLNGTYNNVVGMTLSGPLTATNFPQTVIGSNTNAALGITYVCIAALTLTLPAAPVPGSVVAMSNHSTGNIVIARNGSYIMGLDQDLTIDRRYVSVEFIYTDVTRGWIIK